MNIETLINLFPMASFMGMNFKHVDMVTFDQQSATGQEFLYSYGVVFNRTTRQFAITLGGDALTKMLNQASYQNSRQSQDAKAASFGLILPALDSDHQPTVVYRDLMQYHSAETIRVKARANLSMTYEQVGDNLIVTATGASYVQPEGSTVAATSRLGRPAGSEVSITAAGSATHAIVLWPEWVLPAGFAPQSVVVVSVCDPVVEQYFAEVEETACDSEGRDAVVPVTRRSHVRYQSDAVGEVECDSLSALQFASFDVDPTALDQVTIGGTDLRFYEMLVRTSQDTGEVDTEEISIPNPPSPFSDTDLYQIKAPLSHSNGIGTIGDLLLRIN